MKVEGIPGQFPAHAEMPAVGRCAILPGSNTLRTPTRVECPFCHNPLRLMEGARGRVIYEIDPPMDRKVGTPIRVIIDPMPLDHVALHCSTCRVTFYTPLYRLHQG